MSHSSTGRFQIVCGHNAWPGAGRGGPRGGTFDGVDPWGEHQPPAVGDLPSLPPRLAELLALDRPLPLAPGERFVHPVPVDLPEVAELVQAGWRVADHSPMWSFLPAVWPKSQRCWVPDRLPRFSRSHGENEAVVITPWTPEVGSDVSHHNADLLASVGFPPPPPGRIWLLRSPWPSIGVERVRSLIALRARELGSGSMLDPILVAVARGVFSWGEEDVWTWWPGKWGKVARAWRARGRTGEDAAAVIAACLDPDLIARYEAEGLDEDSALAWTSRLYLYGREGLERALAWSRLGLSPDDLLGLSNADPTEVRQWLAEGFDLNDVRTLEGLTLDQALAWRAVDFPAVQIRQLLRADRTLTTAEALHFLDLGIDDPIPWVEVGFDASAARAWTDLDVLPNEARVWRAAGQSPEKAAPLLAELPADEPRLPKGGQGFALTVTPSGHWRAAPSTRYALGGPALQLNDPANRGLLHYSVDDPPGTRGAQARPARSRRAK